MSGRRPTCALALLAALLAAGCGGGGDAAPTAARPVDDPGYVSDGAHALHYAANLTTDLPAAALAAYRVVPGPRRALLSVSVLAAGPAGLRPVRAPVTATLRTLLGEPRPLPLREVAAAGAPSYVAEFDVRHRELVVIEIEARPAGGAPLRARLPREFWTE